MLTVAFVCEGPTDVPVFEALVAHTLGGRFTPVYLQPNLDAIEPRGGGDTRVEAWCRQNGRSLEWLLEFREVDVLVVHLDADRCAKYGAADTTALCNTIKGWLGPGATRPELIIALPAQATEAWLVAAYRDLTPQYETQPRPENQLAEMKKLERGENGRPAKDPSRYPRMATDLLPRLAAARPVLKELDRFMRKLEAHPKLAGKTA